jgi:colicin import membrane protein
VRRLRPRTTGWFGSLFYAALLHGAIIGSLFISWRFFDDDEPPAMMQASIVRELPPDVERKEADKQAQEEKERVEKERQEDQRKAEAEKLRIAEDQKRKDIERERLVAEQKKQEDEKRKVDQAKREKEEVERKKKAEIERKQAEAQRLKKEQERKLAEQELREQLEKEELVLNAAKEARLASERQKYKTAIEQKVDRNWTGASGRKGLTCLVRIRQTTAGEVLEATVVKSSGDTAFDRSVEQAVYKASPLPSPQVPEVFDRDIEITFKRPEA